MSDRARGTFSLRLKKERNREAVRRLAELQGVTMNAWIETAIEHEVVLQAADLEARLEAALTAVRAYDPDRDLDRYLDAVEEGEDDDLAPGLRVVAEHARQDTAEALPPDAAQVFAAFARS